MENGVDGERGEDGLIRAGETGAVGVEDEVVRQNRAQAPFEVPAAGKVAEQTASASKAARQGSGTRSGAEVAKLWVLVVISRRTASRKRPVL